MRNLLNPEKTLAISIAAAMNNLLIALAIFTQL